MAIHLDRNNMLFGTGSPVGKIVPEYYGQMYVDTLTNPRTVWISTGQYTSSWTAVSDKGHSHSAEGITGLREEVKKLVKEEGIEAALVSLMSNANTWEGPYNNFTGSLLSSGKEVITEGSSLDSLGDVKMEKKKVDSIVGWNGSHYVPYEIKGATPSEDGTIDFGAYVRKDSIVNDLGSADSTAPLAASAGKRILDKVEAEYSKNGHVHTEYAPLKHEHLEYLKRDEPLVTKSSFHIESGEIENPFSITNEYSRIGFRSAQHEDDYSLLSFEKVGGDNAKAIIGGTDGNTGEELVLNFSQITIPTGRIALAPNKKYLPMPALKLENQGGSFVGAGSQRIFGLDINNNPVVGVSQLAFKNPANNATQGILFPKTFAGNTQPSDLGLYHHLRLVNGEMITDTALNSQANYITLGGKRIFFSNTDPGKAAVEGDLWFNI